MSDGCSIWPAGRRTFAVTAVVIGALAALGYFFYIYGPEKETFLNGTAEPAQYPKKKKKKKCKTLNGSTRSSSSSEVPPPVSQYLPAVPPAAVPECSAPPPQNP